MKTASRILSFATTFVLILFVFAAGYVLGQSRWAPLNMVGLPGDTPAEARAAFVPFWEVYERINSIHIDRPHDPDKLVEGAIEGMLASLDDPYSYYLPPQDQQARQDRLEGEFEGIGAYIEATEEGAIVVVSPIDGSPAAAAGIQPGDILRQADGVDLTGMDPGDAAALVRGPAGTDVALVIERDGELIELTITRASIPLLTVTGEIREDQLAYVRISQFGLRTGEELKSKLEELMPQNPKGMILDLRRNPGGSLTAVLEVADQFLPDGVTVIEQFSSGEEEIFSSSADGLAQEIPLVVLVDEGSASASEVLAGALRDRGRALLIGETTFGKGTVQQAIPLRNGGGVNITIARWLTPDKKWVSGSGITPDMIVALPPAEEEFKDTQLDAAVKFLLSDQANN